MPTLALCPHCETPTPAQACSCAHCGGKTRSCPSKLAGLAGTAALALGLTACPGIGPSPEPDYGVAESGLFDEDFDNDGFSEPEDCDDEDPDVNPDAEETAGDGVDSNCNGEDDT